MENVLGLQQKKGAFACRCAAAPSGVHREQEQQDISSYFSAACLVCKILNSFPASSSVTSSIVPIPTKLSKWRCSASTRCLPAPSSWGRMSSSLKEKLKAQKQSAETSPSTGCGSCGLWEMVVHQHIGRPKRLASMKISK